MRHRVGRFRLLIFLILLFGLMLPAYGRGAGLADDTNTPAASPTPTIDNPFLTAGSTPAEVVAQEAKTWVAEALQILGRLLLAVGLSAVLAFRPRQNVPLFKRSLFVSQTQILLAVVAAALMMIVGDNTARAFAIFAAVSLVRFRTNIRDPKEITVLLISLALGLAAGVGRWELGVGLCLFALALLWLLEYNESSQVFRSMELTIKSRNTDRSQEILKKLFRKHKIEAEVREIAPPEGDDPVGSIVFYLNLPLSLSTDYLSDRILRMEPRNVESIQWSQKKGVSDIYQ